MAKEAAVCAASLNKSESKEVGEERRRSEEVSARVYNEISRGEGQRTTVVRTRQVPRL